MVFTRETFTLEQALEQESLILMDTCAQARMGDWYADEVYSHKYFADLNSDVLDVILSEFIFREAIIRNPKVFTVEPVVGELMRFREILRDKTKHMDGIHSSLKQRGGKRYKQVGGDEYDFAMAEYSRSILKDLSFTFHKTAEYAKRKIISNKDRELFVKIAERTYRIAEMPGIKRDYSERHGGAYGGKQEDLHADEELVANSIYLAAIEAKPNAILTADSDISRILNATIISLDKETQWSGIKEILQDNPVRVYFSETVQSSTRVFDTSKPETYF